MGEDTVCFFCYKKRRRADGEMVRKLRKMFVVEEVRGGWETDGVFLYEIRKGKLMPRSGRAGNGV